MVAAKIVENPIKGDRECDEENISYNKVKRERSKKSHENYHSVNHMRHTEYFLSVYYSSYEE